MGPPDDCSRLSTARDSDARGTYFAAVDWIQAAIALPGAGEAPLDATIAAFRGRRGKRADAMDAFCAPAESTDAATSARDAVEALRGPMSAAFGLSAAQGSGAREAYSTLVDLIPELSAVHKAGEAPLDPTVAACPRSTMMAPDAMGAFYALVEVTKSRRIPRT